MRPLMRQTDAPATLLDVGCGAGDHLFFALRRMKSAVAIGVDRSGHAVDLCRTYAAASHPGRAAFVHADLDALETLPASDLILCVTVLQYVERDAALLGKMRRSLHEGGRMLLYVPVRNKRLLPFYSRIVEADGADYDAVQRRRRIYQPDDVLHLLAESGFEVESVEESHGRCGKLAHELQSLVLHGAAHGRMLTRIFAVLSAAVLLPLWLPLMVLDFLLPVRRGNALLILAR